MKADLSRNNKPAAKAATKQKDRKMSKKTSVKSGKSSKSAVATVVVTPTVTVPTVTAPAVSPVVAVAGKKRGRPSGVKNKVYGITLGRLNVVFKDTTVIPVPRSIAVTFFGKNVDQLVEVDPDTLVPDRNESLSVNVVEPTAIAE